MYNYVLCCVRLSIIDDPRAENQKLADHHFEVNGSGFFFGTYCFVFRCGAVVMMMIAVRLIKSMLIAAILSRIIIKVLC